MYFEDLNTNKGDKKFNLNDERGKEWGEIIEIYWKNKKNRSIDNNISRVKYIRRKEKAVEEDKS